MYGIFKSGVLPELVYGEIPDEDIATHKLLNYQAVNSDAAFWFVSPQCTHSNAQGMCVECDDENRPPIDYDYVCSYHEDEPDECCCAPGF